MAPRVFIDGHVGTTGLRIREWLAARSDLSLIAPDASSRKDPGVRRELLQRADVAVLCLPDDAAREAVGWIRDSGTRVLDASTAHRVDPAWVYGLPEMSAEQRGRIAGASLVSNPGCYPSALILGLRPLIDAGLVHTDAALSVRALSGYSGGGRTVIEEWEDPDKGFLTLPFDAPYALERVHKHIPEMERYTGLERAPQFVPAKGAFRDGMRVEIPLHAATLATGANGKRVWEALHERYAGEPFVKVQSFEDPIQADELRFDPRACNGTNRLEIVVAPNAGGHLLLVVLLDNLGKGAAGAAIQNLNLMLGLSETEGLST